MYNLRRSLVQRIIEDLAKNTRRQMNRISMKKVVLYTNVFVISFVASTVLVVCGKQEIKHE